MGVVLGSTAAHDAFRRPYQLRLSWEVRFAGVSAMATTADAFNTLKSDIQPVIPESLSFCDGAEPPAGVDIAQVPSFQDTYIRYEFHPLVSASLWIADRLTRK
jgi:hypothetical protein